ncbi:tight adherence protein C [Microbacterium ginsengiterrae]|uniref:Tight adherence protein C n=1 Tax=Microbacterium ginsengiterrae TaxID=546115 RepID=A0A7W9C9Z9_9MICO|nr:MULTISPECIES: type II secretion system F family protein [Microbacterium]MBB5741766.1 tight adherence protein C [Microbacterium ginsengiterrae]
MTVMTDAAVSVLLGGVLAAGLLCILAAAPRWRAASLTTRIAPYIRDAVEDSVLPSGVLPTVGILPVDASTWWRRARTRMLRGLGDGEALGVRLAQAGLEEEPSAFRARQLGWAIGGTAVGSVLVVVLAVAGSLSPPAAVLPVVCGVGAAITVDMVLTARVRARLARLGDELPTALEFLALCLSAGEGFLDALRRVAMIGSGELSGEMRRVVLDVGTGSPLADALGEMASRLRQPGLARAVDQIVAALEHGAPLAAVLHAQAADAREDAKQALIEQAGRREILMMLPLVFLILPLSVLYAVFPGVFILQLGLG